MSREPTFLEMEQAEEVADLRVRAEKAEAEAERLRSALEYIASGWPDARRAAEDALEGRDPRRASPDGSKADG